MAFTNTYDTTFPVDTQLANLLGADLRNFRVDTQQRMAAISGLDAAKPTFNLDAQPANWVGILFFATDTGKIYKFVNPGWTDVTSSFKQSGKVYSNTTVVNHTGTLTLDTLWTFAMPPLAVGNVVRMTFAMDILNHANATTVSAFIGGTLFALDTYNATTISISGIICYGVQNLTTLQMLHGYGRPSGRVDSWGAITVPDVSLGQAFGIKAQNGSLGDDQITHFFMLEVL